MNRVAELQEAPNQVMRSRDFEQIRRMVYDFCGVDLTGKQVLVDTRLSKKVRESGFPSLQSYCEFVQKNPTSEIFTNMIDVLTTNHTSFFREEQHFDFLKKTILAGMPKASPVRIWSAACSTGEEPYTIAFSLFDALGESAFTRAKILATDISTRVLEKAKRGLYATSALDKVPLSIRRRCLLKGKDKYVDQCLVRPDVRALIDFRRFNLLEDCSEFGPFHVIFCRNVMIYFDQQTQQTLVNKLASRLVPGGHLLIGHSESLNGIKHHLQYVSPATYRKDGFGKNDEDLSVKNLWRRAR